MSGFTARHRLAAALAMAVSAATALGLAGTSVAGAQAPARSANSATKWTKISTNTNLGIAWPGLFRTADGRLHVIWASHDGAGLYSLHYSTVGGATKLLASGTIEGRWSAMTTFPMLVAGPKGGLRLIFNGTNGVSGSPYNTSGLYNATSSSAGKSWMLGTGGLSHTTFVPLTDTAATTEKNGTPIAAWKAVIALDYHVGIDPTIPATASDQTYSIEPQGSLTNPTLATTSSGSVLAGWYDTTGDKNQGYWVAQIWPTPKPRIKAPNSGGKTLANGQPLQPVALVAHAGGGSYLAYCVPTAVLGCGHIALWRVGAAKTLTVPHSSSGNARFVTIAAGHGGHLWISWFDTRTNKISVVRTNTAVTRFGDVRTISAPSPLFSFEDLSSEGGSGPLDVIALAAIHQNASPAFFDTELFPALRIHASKASVSNKQSTTITFTVDDSGDAVPGVKVTFLGKSAMTNSKGVVRFTVKRGTAKGKHSVVATKRGYASAAFTIKVT